jgi:hypothetical protein
MRTRAVNRGNGDTANKIEPNWYQKSIEYNKFDITAHQQVTQGVS